MPVGMIEDNIVRFAHVLGLEAQEIAFLRELPVELQRTIIDSFDASGSKDGNVLGRLQSYTRHMAKRSSASSSTSAAGQSPTATTGRWPTGGDGGGGASGPEMRYQRELLLSYKRTPKAEPPLKILSSMSYMRLAKATGDGTSKASRSSPPMEAPPPPPAKPPTLAGVIGEAPAAAPSKSLSALRPAALGDDVDGSGSPRGKGGLNADAPEFVPFMAQASPAGKQPRTPVSLAKTIAGPDAPSSPPRPRPSQPLQTGQSSPVAAQHPRTPVSLAATIAAPESPARPASFFSSPPAQVPEEPPALSRIKTAPAAPGPPPPSRDAVPQNPFEYHLHRLMFMVVAKCSPSGEEASDPSVGVLLSGLRDEWRQVFGNDVSALMEKCGYNEVEALVKAIDGLRIVGEGGEMRVLTTRATFEGGPAPAPAERRRPPPPPPTAPAPVLTPGGAKVLNLDNFVQSPLAKDSGWGGYGLRPEEAWPPTTPTTGWVQGWQQPFGGGFPGSNDVPEPPSSSAL